MTDSGRRRRDLGAHQGTPTDRAVLRRRILAALLEHDIVSNSTCFCGDRAGQSHLTTVIADATGLPQGWTARQLAAHAIQSGPPDLTCACRAPIPGPHTYGAAEHQAEALTTAIPAESLRLYLNLARKRASNRRLAAPDATMPHVLACTGGVGPPSPAER